MEGRVLRCFFVLLCAGVVFVPCSYAMEEFLEANGVGCCCLKDMGVNCCMNMITCCIFCAHAVHEAAQEVSLAQVVKEEQEDTVPENCNVMGEYCVVNEPGKDYGNNE